MYKKILLRDWETTFLPEEPRLDLLEKDNRRWRPIQIPHNWQDYHGYRGISHGDLHGMAFYRCEISSLSLPPGKATSVRLTFEGVTGTAIIRLNDQIVGEHTGTQVGFTIDLTPYWKDEAPNQIEVQSKYLSTNENQPFFCGGCKGTPFSEGAQPMGIFRPAYLLIGGPLTFENKGCFLWTDSLDEKNANLRFRYEVFNSSQDAQNAIIRVEVKDPQGKIVLSERFTEEISPGELLKSERVLPPLKNPRRWSTSNPQLYEVSTYILSEFELVWDFDTFKIGLRQIKWPTIALPDAEHEICSPSFSKEIIKSGLEPPCPDNDYHNVILKDSSKGPSIESGGIHVWTELEEDFCLIKLDVRLEIKSHAGDSAITIRGELTNEQGTVFYEQFEYEWENRPFSFSLKNPQEWSEENPYLYRLTLDLVAESGEILSRGITRIALIKDRPFGNASPPQYLELSKKEHPTKQIPDSKKRFYVNGEPVAIQGTCAYETLLGADYAWSREQIESFCDQIIFAGFNAFRDGHLPHNLITYDHWDKNGILCWTQMGSHHYLDNESFRDNMRQAVRAWVRERRNHPSVFAWGLQNESIIPEDFARELSAIIAQEDPTTGRDRLVTTCNGGKGTHWNVPQEWSGTYGGNCKDFDIERAQLVGEYGSWRNFGRHADCDYNGDENDLTESWACFSLGTKLNLGIQNASLAMGMFQWPFASFPNPGRSTERKEGTDSFAVAPINSKGILSSWHQPTDIFYLYQSTLLPKEKAPMVYIVSHTWKNRWDTPGIKDRILVYSNCEEVELFNDIGGRSLGRMPNPGPGKPFRWDAVDIQYNVLQARGIIDGKTIATDTILIETLPVAPNFSSWMAPENGDPANLPTHCIRLNCGGHEYRDRWGNTWHRDEPWNPDGPAVVGSVSWAHDFNVSPFDLGSHGSTCAAVKNTTEQSLYQCYRFGRHRLGFLFDIPPGDYMLHLGLIEPWYGIGESKLDYQGHRLFDVYVNEIQLLSSVDPWTLWGALNAGKISAEFSHQGGIAKVHFPNVTSGQALVAWIAMEPLDRTSSSPY